MKIHFSWEKPWLTSFIVGVQLTRHSIIIYLVLFSFSIYIPSDTDIPTTEYEAVSSPSSGLPNMSIRLEESQLTELMQNKQITCKVTPYMDIDIMLSGKDTDNGTGH
jgi:hypothetical protein